MKRGKRQRPDLIAAEEVKEQEIMDMEPGKEIRLYGKGIPPRLVEMICARYMKDGARVRVDMVGESTIRVWL